MTLTCGICFFFVIYYKEGKGKDWGERRRREEGKGKERRKEGEERETERERSHRVGTPFYLISRK